MKVQTKKILKYGLFSGLGFAGLTAVFDYIDGHDFKLWKFLFGFFFFGLAMGASIRYDLKKYAQQEQNSN
ncbi:hypothetical protein [Maribacter arenosus]|uniref:F0F1-ATPase subunit Ca2+/Mg2+ transporter n=1 Tax=Maribacter arenosus TaxID=1854708 RepID=A0ABR7VJ40_9FLAO|nr:hypothetical protein [Maribacter arenosus]MBD0852074.1 hypothetical protein [Maribacter arenosus]